MVFHSCCIYLYVFYDYNNYTHDWVPHFVGLNTCKINQTKKFLFPLMLKMYCCYYIKGVCRKWLVGALALFPSSFYNLLRLYVIFSNILKSKNIDNYNLNIALSNKI